MNCADPPGHYSNQFCLQGSFNKHHEIAKNCVGDCIAKACLPRFMEYKCKTSETIDYPQGTLSCCQGDFCNGAVKLSDRNVFLCAIVLLVYLFY